MSFPKQFPFNGIDYFLYQLDLIMQKSSGNQNVCSLVLELDNNLDGQWLESHLQKISSYHWLTSLRIKRGWPFKRIRWHADYAAQCPDVTEHFFSGSDEITDKLIGQSLDIRNQSPFKIDIVHTQKHKTQLVFTWHHALMDAHGAERFIHFLGMPEQLNQPEWIRSPGSEKQKPLRERALIARDLKKILYQTSELPLLSLYQGQHTGQKDAYYLLRFSRQETGVIARRSRGKGAGFLTSAFYLAATARAVAYIQKKRKPMTADMLIPVPQDRRKRGSSGTVLGNQTTVIFYRIAQSVLADLELCTAEIIRQMADLMRADIPANYLVMMDMLQRIPGPIYRYLLKSPTAGLMGSFFYSDTGDSLADYKQLFNGKVLDAVHYPPNTSPPGVTFIYTRFHGALQVTIGYMDSIINRAELEQICAHLRADLLGVEVNAAIG